MINKVRNTVPWTYVMSDLKGKVIAGTFYEKELQNVNQKELQGNKLYVKWKGYDSFLTFGLTKKT